MKIYIDAFGAHSKSLIELLTKAAFFEGSEIFVRTYDHPSCSELIDYLTKNKISFETNAYTDSLIKLIEKFNPNLILSVFRSGKNTKLCAEFGRLQFEYSP